jgi:hypothetical protein
LIVLDLEKSYHLLQAEAADRRLELNHIKRPNFEVKLRILKSGYQGEKTLQYYTGLIPKGKYSIFHGLRLPIGNSYFQIDGLLLSTKIIFILEGKNNAGMLTIDKHQLTQEYNDDNMIFQNPVSQVNRHKILLGYFFEEECNIPLIPIEPFAVITRSTAEVKIAPGYLEGENRVCKADDLLKEIGRVEKYYPKEVIDKNTKNKIKNMFLKKHAPLKSDLLEELDIDKTEILTGVCCPKCKSLPMEYNRNLWLCNICQFTSKDAFVEGINDYFLLVKPTITNAELRAFLHLPSQRAAQHIFSLLNLPSTGQNKGRVYHQPKLFPLTVNHVFPNKTNTKKKQK